MAVVAVRVERVGRDPFLLVGRRGGERRDRFLDLVALRVDVPRHVQRVRDVGDEPGVALVRVPRLLRHLAAFVGVNQIVMRAELPVVFRDDLFEQRDRFHRVLARLLAWPVRSRCRSRGRASTSLRDRRDTRRPACAGRRCRRRRPASFGPGRAARRLRFDVEPLARRHLVAQRHRLGDRFTRADLRVDRGAAGRAGHVASALGSAAARRARRRRCPDRAAAGTPGGSRWRRSARCTSSAIAMSLSSSSACVHDRSDSWNQNEWICETPCRKNLRASSDVVVTGKSLVTPMPGSSFAGSSGCAPGGTMHMSGWRRLRLFALGREVRRTDGREQDDQANTGDVLHGAKYSSRSR